MKTIWILNCSGDISTCCSDYGLAQMLSVMKSFFHLIQIMVPIILLIMTTIQLVKMMANPDEKKNTKALINKFIAALICFFLPTIINVLLNALSLGAENVLSKNFQVAACWDAADEVNEIIKVSKSVYISKNDKDSKYFLNNPDEYNPGNEKDNSTSSGNGNILLIAGHSYPPYCSGAVNDCRGMIASGYDETDQTRILVKLIKKELDNLGVKSDIANALMANDTDRMNKSFYIECRTGSELCNKYNWQKYKYVLEIHFNASGSGTAAGTHLVKQSSSYSTKADQAIVQAVIKNTGKRQYSDYIYGAFNIGYFMSRNVPITYLETEFYDNKSAMDNYSKKKEQIAKDIAKAIQQYYG